MVPVSDTDSNWMQAALEEAGAALRSDEIPIGAVLVQKNSVLAADHNRTREMNDPLAHAEKLVIEKVLKSGTKYLQDCTLYITVEPCLMCAGMIIWSRVGRVVYGCSDPKAGCAGSIYNALQDRNFNHQPELISGVLATESAR
ncbi:MAG: nucleoside deaminase, partial [Candidatus Cloacimonetes bacterium]|nr:nucleoside deaminase [Candidatus Cloacimonadota bacterium]